MPSTASCAGVHPKLVQELLGHARVAITLDLYSHVVEEMHHDATDKLGRLLFPEGKPLIPGI